MPKDQKIAIFGDNEYAISMILETLSTIYRHALDIPIIINREFKPKDSFNEGQHNTFLMDEADFIEHTNVFGYLAGMSPASRSFLFYRYQNGTLNLTFPALIHPSSVLPHQIQLGQAVRIEPNVTIAPFVKIGIGVLINRGVIIGHHTTIGDFVNLNPGAIINGNCHIGTGTTIGSGAIINDKIKIGNNSVIGSGAIVTKDIPDQVVAFGQPAKIIKENKEIIIW